MSIMKEESYAFSVAAPMLAQPSGHKITTPTCVWMHSIDGMCMWILLCQIVGIMCCPIGRWFVLSHLVVVTCSFFSLRLIAPWSTARNCWNTFSPGRSITGVSITLWRAFVSLFNRSVYFVSKFYALIIYYDSKSLIISFWLDL